MDSYKQAYCQRDASGYFESVSDGYLVDAPTGFFSMATAEEADGCLTRSNVTSHTKLTAKPGADGRISFGLEAQLLSLCAPSPHPSHPSINHPQRLRTKQMITPHATSPRSDENHLPNTLRQMRP